METETIVCSVEKAFESSNSRQSRQLFMKIINAASKKLSPQQLTYIMKLSPQLSLRQKTELRPKKTRKLKKIRRKTNIRTISKIKLREVLISKFSNQNKKIHSQILSNRQQQRQKRLKHLFSQTNFSPVYEYEQQKLEQNQIQNSEKVLKNNKLVQIVERIYKPPTVVIKDASLRVHLQKKFKQIKRNFKKYLSSDSEQSKIQDIACPICIDILINPFSTLCGHSFCFKCLDESLLFGSNCPVCRVPIKGLDIMPCLYLDKLIKTKCQKWVDKETLQNYRVRQKQRTEWKQQRTLNLNTIAQGVILDVRDTQKIWCKARIAKIYYNNKKISSILVHYLQWAKLYDEIIEIKSTRLAPRDHFSSRPDITHYNLNSEEQNLREAVITGTNQQRRRQNDHGIGFPNMAQLNSLRNSLNNIRNNMQNIRNQRPQQRHFNIFGAGNQVNFLHQFIGIERQNQEGLFDLSQSQLGVQHDNIMQDQEASSQLSSSSIGSFVFRPAPDSFDQQSGDQEQDLPNLQGQLSEDHQQQQNNLSENQSSGSDRVNFIFMNEELVSGGSSNSRSSEDYHQNQNNELQNDGQSQPRVSEYANYDLSLFQHGQQQRQQHQQYERQIHEQQRHNQEEGQRYQEMRYQVSHSQIMPNDSDHHHSQHYYGQNQSESQFFGDSSSQ